MFGWEDDVVFGEMPLTHGIFDQCQARHVWHEA